jgi:hypothetical protein
MLNTGDKTGLLLFARVQQLCHHHVDCSPEMKKSETIGPTVK